MAKLTAEKETLDAWLASETAYAEDAKDELKSKVARQGELAWQLARLETAWLEISESLDRVSLAS
jgi:ATP-binding cassette subfamily F protein 3